jgi:hypothetical protein
MLHVPYLQLLALAYQALTPSACVRGLCSLCKLGSAAILSWSIEDLRSSNGFALARAIEVVYAVAKLLVLVCVRLEQLFSELVRETPEA